MTTAPDPDSGPADPPRLWWTVRDQPAALLTVLGEAAATLADADPDGVPAADTVTVGASAGSTLPPGAGEATAVAMLSSPTDHVLAELRADATMHTPDGAVDPDGVFAAQAFSPRAELRWIQTGGGAGDAVLVAEQPLSITGWTARPVPTTDHIEGSYVLWGRRLVEHPDTDQWWRCEEGRLGWIDVPRTRTTNTAPQAQSTAASTGPDREWPDRYLALTYREYLGVDEHGNATVTDERLTGLTIATPTTGTRR